MRVEGCSCRSAAASMRLPAARHPSRLHRPQGRLRWFRQSPKSSWDRPACQPPCPLPPTPSASLSVPPQAAPAAAAAAPMTPAARTPRMHPRKRRRKERRRSLEQRPAARRCPHLLLLLAAHRLLAQLHPSAGWHHQQWQQLHQQLHQPSSAPAAPAVPGPQSLLAVLCVAPPLGCLGRCTAH